jgi:hypothetical protein
MAASREALNGRFPMPTTLVTAFRSGAKKAQPMLILGGMYAAALLLVVAFAGLVGSASAPVELQEGTQATPEMAVQAIVNNPGFWFGLLLYLPTVMAFWHAPALVHWHQVPPLKSVFFSLVACLRNLLAFIVFGLMWIGITMALIVIVSLLSSILGNPQIAGVVLVPGTLMIAAMIFTSTYFSFRDCFLADPDAPVTDTTVA